jgi:hypothetical protein
MITKQNVEGNDRLDSDANYHRGQTELTTLDAGENDLSWDLGLYLPILKDINGRVWNDTDRDGIQDINENGVPNITITLVKNDILQISSEQTVTAITTVISDENGSYIFENVEIGEPHHYHLVFDNRTLPKDYSFTKVDVGNDDTIDSDVNPSTGETTNVVLGTTGVSLTYDAGIQMFRVVDDSVVANSDGPTTIISILNNDGGNINNETILFVDVEEGQILYDTGTAVAGTSLNTFITYKVAGEGIWRVESNGKISFTAQDGFDGIPSPVYYVVQGLSGNQSNIAKVTITTPCTCDPYVENSVSTLSLKSILIILFLSSVLGMILARREFESHI